MIEAYTAMGDIRVLPYYEPAGELGYLPVNAYLIKGREPILVDTGMAGTGDEFLAALRDEIDLEELRWIFATHEDRDHSGNLGALLELAPNARVVMNFLCMLKLGTDAPVTPDRVYFVNPGQSFTAGDRTIHVIRPPLFDSAASVGFFDEQSRALFSADSFGALIPRPAEGANDVMDGFGDGFVIFNHANHAWIGLVDPDKFAGSLDKGVRRMGAEAILAGHAPALVGRTDEMIGMLAALPAIEPMTLPDDAAFREMLARMKAAGPPEARAADAA